MTQTDTDARTPDAPLVMASAAPTKLRRAFSPVWLVMCLAFVFVRLPFMFTVPMSEAPDEATHFWVIRFLHDNLRLPSASEISQHGIAAVYGSLPQFGYLPHVLISFLAPVGRLQLYDRFGSLLGGLVLLYAAYQCARELFPQKKLLQLALPAVIIFHPQLAFLHAYANNDATAAALSAVLLMLTLRSIRTGITVARSAFMGLLIGWLVLSKYSGVAVVPAVAVGLIGAAWINRTRWQIVLSSAFACIAACAATCGWWFWRNAHEFGGDYLGTRTMYQTWALATHKDLNYYLPVERIAFSLRWWRMMWFSFLGMFGYMTRYLFRPVYLIYTGFLIAAGVGLLGQLRNGMAKVSQSPPAKPDPRAAQVPPLQWSCMAITIATNLAAMIWASTGNLGGPQGRYLFISEVPVMALLLLGLSKLGGRHGDRLVGAFLLFNAVVCIGAWLMLFLMYRWHPNAL